MLTILVPAFRIFIFSQKQKNGIKLVVCVCVCVCCLTFLSILGWKSPCWLWKWPYSIWTYVIKAWFSLQCRPKVIPRKPLSHPSHLWGRLSDARYPEQRSPSSNQPLHFRIRPYMSILLSSRRNPETEFTVIPWGTTKERIRESKNNSWSATELPCNIHQSKQLA